MHELNYHKATSPDDLALRAIVNDSPVQLFCPALRLGCRRYGASVMIDATRRLLEQWRLSFARDTII